MMRILDKKYQNITLFFLQSNSADPFELRNMESSLSPNEKSFLHDTLEHMKSCKGKNCILQRRNQQSTEGGDETSNNINSMPFKGSRRRIGECFRLE